jgi:hypothetical protein
VQAVGRANLLGERGASGAMVGMYVRVDDVRDAHALRFGERSVGVDVFLVGVDNGALTEAAAAEQVRGAAGLEVIVGLEDHWTAPSVSTRQPRARQSTTPCSMRWALKPFFRSSSTASTAITQYGPRQ